VKYIKQIRLLKHYVMRTPPIHPNKKSSPPITSPDVVVVETDFHRWATYEHELEFHRHPKDHVFVLENGAYGYSTVIIHGPLFELIMAEEWKFVDPVSWTRGGAGGLYPIVKISVPASSIK
jgi:hypothetical protein